MHYYLIANILTFDEHSKALLSPEKYLPHDVFMDFSMKVSNYYCHLSNDFSSSFCSKILYIFMTLFHHCNYNKYLGIACQKTENRIFYVSVEKIA